MANGAGVDQGFLTQRPGLLYTGRLEVRRETACRVDRNEHGKRCKQLAARSGGKEKGAHWRLSRFQGLMQRERGQRLRTPCRSHSEWAQPAGLAGSALLLAPNSSLHPLGTSQRPQPQLRNW